jgi:small-conductance mechanosensitive channel
MPSGGVHPISFALFIRQAEKLDTVRSWRREQPQGAWEKIARPLGYLLPIAIVILAALALMAGESLANVLPIVLGAGPALLATILPGRRPA